MTHVALLAGSVVPKSWNACLVSYHRRGAFFLVRILRKRRIASSPSAAAADEMDAFDASVNRSRYEESECAVNGTTGGLG